MLRDQNYFARLAASTVPPWCAGLPVTNAFDKPSATMSDANRQLFVEAYVAHRDGSSDGAAPASGAVKTTLAQAPPADAMTPKFALDFFRSAAVAIGRAIADPEDGALSVLDMRHAEAVLAQLDGPRQTGSMCAVSSLITAFACAALASPSLLTAFLNVVTASDGVSVPPAQQYLIGAIIACVAPAFVDVTKIALPAAGAGTYNLTTITATTTCAVQSIMQLYAAAARAALPLADAVWRLPLDTTTDAYRALPSAFFGEHAAYTSLGTPRAVVTIHSAHCRSRNHALDSLLPLLYGSDSIFAEERQHEAGSRLLQAVAAATSYIIRDTSQCSTGASHADVVHTRADMVIQLPQPTSSSLAENVRARSYTKSFTGGVGGDAPNCTVPGCPGFKASCNVVVTSQPSIIVVSMDAIDGHPAHDGETPLSLTPPTGSADAATHGGGPVSISLIAGIIFGAAHFKTAAVLSPHSISDASGSTRAVIMDDLVVYGAGQSARASASARVLEDRSAAAAFFNTKRDFKPQAMLYAVGRPGAPSLAPVLADLPEPRPQAGRRPSAAGGGGGTPRGSATGIGSAGAGAGAQSVASKPASARHQAARAAADASLFEAAKVDVAAATAAVKMADRARKTLQKRNTVSMSLYRDFSSENSGALSATARRVYTASYYYVGMGGEDAAAAAAALLAGLPPTTQLMPRDGLAAAGAADDAAESDDDDDEDASQGASKRRRAASDADEDD